MSHTKPAAPESKPQLTPLLKSAVLNQLNPQSPAKMSQTQRLKKPQTAQYLL